jgi:hypothetical protein
MKVFTCFILERVDIVYCENSCEAYAYFIQYLTEEIYNKLDIKFKVVKNGNKRFNSKSDKNKQTNILR